MCMQVEKVHNRVVSQENQKRLVADGRSSRFFFTLRFVVSLSLLPAQVITEPGYKMWLSETARKQNVT